MALTPIRVASGLIISWTVSRVTPEMLPTVVVEHPLATAVTILLATATIGVARMTGGDCRQNFVRH